MKIYLALLLAITITFSGAIAMAQDAGTGDAAVEATQPAIQPVAKIPAATPKFEVNPDKATAQPTSKATAEESDVHEAFDDVVAGKNYARALASLLLIGVVWLFRKKGVSFIPGAVGKFLATDRGGVLVTLALAFFGALAHALMSSAAISVSLFWAAAMVAVGAIGGYAGLRRLLWPKDA